MEKRFIQNACPKLAVRRIGVNGRAVHMAQVAKRIASQLRIGHRNTRNAIIVFDREQRVESVECLRAQLEACLAAEGLSEQRFHTCIVDRSTEDWIAADVNALAKYLGVECGALELRSSGQATIEASFKACGRYYHKTTDGVELLKRISVPAICAKCPHAKRFFSTFSWNCWWLQPPQARRRVGRLSSKGDDRL